MKYMSLILPVALAACATHETNETQLAPMTYACEGEQIGVIFGTDEIILDRADGRMTLPIAVSGSGTRYEGEDVSFHEKGGEAILTVDGVDQICETVPLRAGGNEPFWSVEVTDDQMTLSGPSEAPVTVPVTSQGKTTPTGWNFAGEGLSLTVTDARCDDTMADRSYPFTASVTVDDMVMTGCAGAWFGDGA